MSCTKTVNRPLLLLFFGPLHLLLFHSLNVWVVSINSNIYMLTRVEILEKKGWKVNFFFFWANGWKVIMGRKLSNFPLTVTLITIFYFVFWERK